MHSGASSCLSVLDFMHLGSSLALRSFGTIGSATSLFALTRFGSSVSVLDFLHVDSHLLFNFARLGPQKNVWGDF